MKLIFISQPYSYNPKEAYEDAKIFARYVAAFDYIPISPVLMFHHTFSNKDYQQIIYNCFTLIKLCDEIWIFNPKNILSHGVLSETAYAQTLQKIVKLIEITEETYERYKNSFIEN